MEKTTEQLCAFLKAETERIEQSTKRFYYWSFVGLVGLMGYMLTISVLVQRIIQTTE